MEVSLALAFAAGVLSFVTPCVLALVPVYLAYLGETAAAVSGIGGSSAALSPQATSTRPLIGQVLLFTLSFAAVFVFLGVAAGLLGASLFRLIPYAREVTGLLVVVMGLAVTGLFGPLTSRLRFGLRLEVLPDGRSARSVTLGALFALGWSPCIGPVLGAILTMGASSQDVGIAALLLSAYGLGLAAPFIAVAVALPRVQPLMVVLRRWHRAVEVTAGLFIVAMGILVYLNAFTRMASLFTWTI
jgi:cytochrome c-type biogenesis protein